MSTKEAGSGGPPGRASRPLSGARELPPKWQRFGVGGETQRKTLLAGSSGLRVSAIEILLERRVQRPVWEPEEHHPRARAWHFRIDAHHPIITRAPSQELADSPGPLFLSERPRKRASTRERENQSRKRPGRSKAPAQPQILEQLLPSAGRKAHLHVVPLCCQGPSAPAEALKEAGAGVRGACGFPIDKRDWITST